MKVMVFSESYDLVSLNVSVQLSLSAESDKSSSILPRTSTHTPKASYRSESAKRSLIWLHSRNVTKNQHYWHESPYMFLNTMEIKIFNITIFSFCESNNPPYKIFSLCENSELHWNLWIFWSYSLWANVSGQRSRSYHWTDFIQGMGPKFHNFQS